MANFSNAKFAIGLTKQADKDTINTADLVRYPFLYGNGSGFDVVPEADTYQDVVDPIFESSKTQILGAVIQGGVEVPMDAGFAGLILGTMLNSINTTNPESGVYQHVIEPLSTTSPNFHTILYSDGTCDSRIVGAVPTQIAFGADFQNKRMNASVGFTAIRMEDNDGANAGAVTVVNATDIWTRSTHGYADGDAVMLTNSGGALPTGSNNTTVYYVQVINANTFYLHTTWQGSVNHLTGTRLNVSSDGSGTHTATRLITAYPSQAAINPFHFVNTGALLTLNIDGAGAVDYTDKFAGFSYTLQDGISAEQRSGSNTYRVIERVDRVQQLNLVLDYDSATLKDIIRDYQKKSQPNKFEIIVQLQGALIGASTTYHYSMKAQFYNCNLIAHSYTRTPEIGKQTLGFSVNHDTGQSKSVTWTIVNDVDGYLT
jgi:hypothetical protein